MMDLINAWIAKDYVEIERLLQGIFDRHRDETKFRERFFFIMFTIRDNRTLEIGMRIINSGERQYARPASFTTWNERIYYIAYIENTIEGYLQKGGLNKNALAAQVNDYGAIVADEKCWQYLPSPFREICAVRSRTATKVTTIMPVIHQLAAIEEKIGKTFDFPPDKFLIIPETLEEIYGFISEHPNHMIRRS